MLKSARFYQRLLFLMAMLLFVIGMANQAQAQGPTGQVEVSKAVLGGATTVDTGVEFTYLINYKYASTTDDGAAVTLVDMLDPSINWAAAQVVVGTTNHIASTNYNPATGQVTWTFVNPLPAGASGQLELKVRFPNGTTPPGTVANNTATMDADNADPYTSNNVAITANATCGWNTNVTGPGTAMLDTDVTYVARLDQPSPSTGNLNVIAPSTTSMTLPVGVLPGDVINTNGGTISGTGTTGDPVVVTWTVTHSVGSNYTRNLVIRYESARSTASQAVTVAQSSTMMPRSMSRNTRSSRPLGENSTSTSSYPRPVTTCSISCSTSARMYSTCPSNAARPAPQRAPQIKNGRNAHQTPPPAADPRRP